MWITSHHFRIVAFMRSLRTTADDAAMDALSAAEMFRVSPLLLAFIFIA
jgi:hypothetical protein